MSKYRTTWEEIQRDGDHHIWLVDLDTLPLGCDYSSLSLTTKYLYAEDLDNIVWRWPVSELIAFKCDIDGEQYCNEEHDPNVGVEASVWFEPAPGKTTYGETMDWDAFLTLGFESWYDYKKFADLITARTGIQPAWPRPHRVIQSVEGV